MPHYRSTATAQWRTLSLLLAGSVLLSGCFSHAPKRDPEFAPVLPQKFTPPVAQNGAIYQAGYELMLFEDIKARRVGDILIIQLEEKTDAKKEAKTSADKATTTTIANPTVFGAQASFNLPKLIPLESNTGNNLSANLRSDNEFEGSGDSTQSNELEGSVSVTVVEVLPNGNLVVRGEKRVAINQGTEYVRLSGIVRPVDIGPDNVVSSTKVADATIQYVGDGAVADANEMGWLARFFISAVWPF